MVRRKGMRRLSKWLGYLLLLVLHFGLRAQTRTVHLYYTDPQGNVLAKTDAQGNIIARYDYRPYGSVVQGAGPNGLGYAGHVNDLETDLSYMQRRYYDYGTGRFLSPDPIGPSADNLFAFNRYDYTNNNPVRYTDPFGLYTCQGNASDCATIEKARQDVITASKNLPAGSLAQNQLNAIVAFYGKPGVANGVNVIVNGGTIKGKAIGGGASRGKDGKTINVGINLKNIAAAEGSDSSVGFYVRLAGDIAHEGTHGNDEKNNNWGPDGRADEYAGEIRAYKAQASVYWGLNQYPNPGGLWSPSGGINEPAVLKDAQDSTNIWCSAKPGGC
jgi:RHS repeat-associated protein